MSFTETKSSIVPGVLVVLCVLSAAVADDVYVDSEGANTIVRVSANGTQSVFATAATGIDCPAGMAFDPAGNLYVANQGVNYAGYAYIEEYAPSGAASQFTTWGVTSPLGLACDGAGNLYAANLSEILEYAAAGGRYIPYQGGTISLAESLAFDNAGNLYAGNVTNVVWFASGHHGAVYATPPSGYVYGLAFDRAGDMFVSLSQYQFSPGPIYEYSAAGQWSLFATANAGQIAFDSAGNLYAMEGNGAIEGTAEIMEYAPDGTPTVLATGFDPRDWIAVGPAPEPATLSLLALGALAVLRRRRG